MKVESVIIRNFKGIQNESLSIKGHNVYVIGKNGAGKTSFNDAIFKILSGNKYPSKPTHQGTRNGEIEIDLGKIIVKAKFNEKNEKIIVSVENKEGAEYKSPRTMLDELVGVLDFDINEFLSSTPKKQVEFIKNIAGIDFSDLDEEYKSKFDERTFVNRKVKDLEAKAGLFDKNKVTPHDLSVKTKELNEKRKFNESYQDGWQQITDAKKRLETIQAEMAKLQREADELSESIQVGDAWLIAKENQPYNIASEEIEFEKLIEENKKIEENIRNQKAYEDFKVALETQKQLNEALEAIEHSKRSAISEAKLPVPGLSFNDDTLLYNGLPLESAQINKAQQIIIGLQLNLALIGEVRIARFEGSLIDDENMKQIEAWAVENDLQLFVEFVDRSENLKIEVKEVL